MTCKDCVHCYVCRYNDGANEWCKDVTICEHFADKSKFIELPCKVGDVVYSIETLYYNNSLHSGIQKGIIKGIEIGKRCYVWVNFENDIHTSRIAFVASNFGKTIFSTYEEAQQALKGCDN